MKKCTLSLLASSLLLASLCVQAAIPKGDGIILNDVPDLLVDSGASGYQFTETTMTYLRYPTIKYLFPDFMNMLPGLAKTQSNTLVQSTCPTGAKAPLPTALNFVAYNQLKAKNTADFGPECLTASQLLTIMHNVNPNAHIMPMIDGSATGINGMTDTKEVVNMAMLIANAINQEPYAAGVSFDLEGPALDGSHSAQLFISTLANALLKQKKYVAIFDGTTVMTALQQAGALPANVFALHALYDAGTCNKNNPHDPCTPAQYQTNGATAGNPTFPTMEVIPAAGTTRLYEQKIIVNKIVNTTPAPTATNPHPKPQPSPIGPSAASAIRAKNCASVFGNTYQPFNSYITNDFVCKPSVIKNDNHYTCGIGSAGPLTGAYANFVGAKDCALYTNILFAKLGEKPSSGALQQQYVSIALTDKVSKVLSNPNFIGVALYNIKPSQDNQGLKTRAFNALTATKGYYNIDIDTAHYFQGYYPESITDLVWTTYKDWRKNNPIK